MKRCKRCGKEKDFTYFWKNGASNDGYRATCIMCETEQRSNPPAISTKSGTTREVPIKNGILSGGNPPDGPEEIPNLYQFSYRHNGKILDFAPCPVCNKSNHLFQCSLLGSTRVLEIKICSMCVLHSEYGNIVYTELYGNIYAVRLIEVEE